MLLQNHHHHPEAEWRQWVEVTRLPDAELILDSGNEKRNDWLVYTVPDFFSDVIRSDAVSTDCEGVEDIFSSCVPERSSVLLTKNNNLLLSSLYFFSRSSDSRTGRILSLHWQNSQWDSSPDAQGSLWNRSSTAGQEKRHAIFGFFFSFFFCKLCPGLVQWPRHANIATEEAGVTVKDCVTQWDS